MIRHTTRFFLAPAFALLVACGETSIETAAVAGNDNRDAEIAAQVESALSSASDLPSNFAVDVVGGQVLITGSLQCEDCGGMRTPGNTGTIQQSLGAVVRAVPGVTAVEFNLDYSP